MLHVLMYVSYESFVIINHNSWQTWNDTTDKFPSLFVGVGGANEQNTMSEKLKNPRGMARTPVPHLSGVLYGKGWRGNVVK